LFSTTWRTRSSIGAARDEVEDLHALALAHPVHAADALLEDRRVPGTSRLTTTEAASCRLSPSPPASVEKSTRSVSSERNASIVADAWRVHAPVEDRGLLAAPVEQRPHDVDARDGAGAPIG
jgi:hypothetical protein